MKLLKNILINVTTPEIQDALWFRPQNNGGTSLYVPNGIHWKKVAIFGESDEGDGDEYSANVKEIYEGILPPENKQKVWLDPDTGASLDEPEYSGLVSNILAMIADLQKKTTTLYKLYEIGVVAGDATTSPRTMMTEAHDVIKPEDAEGDDDGTKPDVSDANFTVPAIAVKCDDASKFVENKQNLGDGEILFFTDVKKLKIYYKGSFYGASGSDGGGGSGDGGITIDDLYNLVLEYLNFTDGDVNYRFRVHKNGEIGVHEYSDDITLPGPKVTNNVYVNHLLCMNTIYCGGNGNEGCLVSHNFVELANGSNKDVNLNGLFLLYTNGAKRDPDDVGFIWKVLPLKGVIKTGHTFLIRGAQCHDMKSSFIKVKDYDMEWYDGKNLIQFSQTSSSFYLCAGSPDENWVYDENGELLGKNDLRSPWASNRTYVGYIDSCGFSINSTAVQEGTAAFNVVEDWNKCMFVRWFMFEPASQGNKTYAKRTTTGLWTYINLERQTQSLSLSRQYYYTDWVKQLYTPCTSHEGKGFFSTRSTFSEEKPNMVNITFGIQATSDDANDVKASRCFNWVSVGYYDEFLEYRKKGTSVWTKVYSIEENNPANGVAISQFIQFYKRYRWCSSNGTWVTTHKVVLSNTFESGDWEYRVGRDGNDLYYSEVFSFKVTDNSEIENGFTFAQVTDQQGFNWAEYQAWKKTADCLKETDRPLFTVNTGDITQSGNRESEWLDYHDGRKAVRELEEMFTIGNNDLCGHDATKLTDGADKTSKYNHINILRYYTFELDPRNDYFFTWQDNQYPLYSLYSFNFGKWHFTSLNSETAIPTSKSYVDYEDDGYAGDPTFAQTANATIEDWLKRDLQLFKHDTADNEIDAAAALVTDPSDCKNVFVYMHENPFTMVTWDFMKGTTGREGSHLNTLNSNGLYRFSRLFKKYGIRLVFGGHKHTYTLSKPIYDAPEGYVSSSGVVNPEVDLMGTVDRELSRKPVIQVTRDEDIIAQHVNNGIARYEVVQKINAPTYVMSQASGYKLVSNKEQPSGDEYVIPWLLSYFKAKTNATEPTENRKQHYPMYITYDVTPESIVVTAKQVHGIWNVNEVANKASYDMNNQLTNVQAHAMTLQETSEADMDAYGLTDIESYTIEL